MKLMKPFGQNAGLIFVGLLALVDSASPDDRPAPSFNRDIRPILSENCFACHGPDAKHREAGLRLDVQEDALSHLESDESVAPFN